jgi:hypothetical protein
MFSFKGIWGGGASQPKKAILAQGPWAREASPAQGGKPGPGRQAQPREASPAQGGKPSQGERQAPARGGWPQPRQAFPKGFLMVS